AGRGQPQSPVQDRTEGLPAPLPREPPASQPAAPSGGLPPSIAENVWVKVLRGRGAGPSQP
ncbi:MAG: hypothetical protein ACP5I3_11860, partial [Thermoproteus sp.]